MKEQAIIEKVRIIEVNMPFTNHIQVGESSNKLRKSLIIELHSEGIIGYGESAPYGEPFYSGETISTVKPILKENILPKIVGKEISSIEQLNQLINTQIKGNNFAKAGVETAYWDLIAKKRNIPLKQLIHEKLMEIGVNDPSLNNTNYILSGAAMGIPPGEKEDNLVEQVKSALEEGYQKIKIKVSPGFDINAIEKVLKVIPDDINFWMDASASYNIKNHLPILKQIDSYNIDFLEQPLAHDDILEHSQLSQEVTTPICLDESLYSAKIAENSLGLGFNQIWNIKIQRIGGLLEALKIYKLASENNVSVWGGTMPETGIGAIFMLALGTYSNFTYPSDVADSTKWYGNNNDLKDLKMTGEGKIFYSDEIGIGEINHYNYRKYGHLVHEVNGY
ncbi:o-succinylbenzoate synthase [Natranaerobius thermophilus]|uniref:o-succinylbenzoate synthase n=1 Tax=Natranaerobius thermophilus (strain ATCC BAA-1301 / DSM 18059 / JW/NM-WN-LF) TaxID=457570 RepID=B2A420_NATTJ|nr:o-succinylbenzoate synthase [Natranaerobius thermophilus]ACB85122.1 Mandelate racemase/muconate lactonizing protein [Natranaerobius thermophilus JW/NM-WN-LF]